MYERTSGLLSLAARLSPSPLFLSAVDPASSTDSLSRSSSSTGQRCNERSTKRGGTRGVLLLLRADEGEGDCLLDGHFQSVALAPLANLLSSTLRLLTDGKKKKRLCCAVKRKPLAHPLSLCRRCTGSAVERHCDVLRISLSFSRLSPAFSLLACASKEKRDSF